MKNKLRSWGRSLLLDVSIRSKLLCIYFLLLLLPLGLFTMYAFRRINSVIEEQTFSSAQKAFTDTENSINDLFGRLSQVIDILVMDPTLYSLAASSPQDTSYIQRLQDRNHISLTFERLRSLSGVDRIRMYVGNDYLYTNSTDIVSLESVKDSRWLEILSPDQPACWFSPADFSDQPSDERGWYSLMRVIYDPGRIHEPLAVIRADISAERIDSAIGGSTITQNGTVFLLDQNGALCSRPIQAGIQALFPAMMSADVPAGWRDISTKYGQFHIQSCPLEYSGYVLCAALPHDDVFRASHELQSELLFAVLFLAASSYLLACLLSQSFLNRLLRLTDTMHKVEQGNVSVRLAPEGRDEIGQLMGSFSNMMSQIDTLMDEKLAQGQQIKALELKALQAQINPHFLYNSLDLINCTAITNHVPQISKMVNSLAQFYRLSLSKGKETISLADEFRHARLYVEIQNMRFEDRIHVVWNIEPEIEQFQIIKIVLQPIIENAIIHGIFEKPDKTGTITISAQRRQEDVRITVLDDGVGMDALTLERNFAPAPFDPHAKGGYGVRNINERLRLAYGAPYGLSCQSIPGQGTRVTILIPARKIISA